MVVGVGFRDGVVVGEVAGAVVPQADVVEIFDRRRVAAGGRGILVEELGDHIGDVHVRALGVYVRRVGSEKVEFIEAVVAFVCAAEPHGDEKAQ